MALIDGILQELDHEAQATRRVLERVPDSRLDWKPQVKARSLGQLALHIALIPGAIAQLAAAPSPVQAPQFTDPMPKSCDEVLMILDQSLATAKKVLAGMDDGKLMAKWQLMRGNEQVMAVPRIAVLRTIMLNHWYHHRGQLTVYLRELGVPVPPVYGPSGDENPFA